MDAELGKCAVRRSLKLFCPGKGYEAGHALLDACVPPCGWRQNGGEPISRQTANASWLELVTFIRDPADGLERADMVLEGTTDGYELVLLEGFPWDRELAVADWNRVVEDFEATVVRAAADRVVGLRCELGPAAGGPVDWFGLAAGSRLAQAVRQLRRPHRAFGGGPYEGYIAALDAIHCGRLKFEHGDLRNWLIECEGWSAQDAQDCAVASAAVMATLAYRDGRPSNVY